MDTFLRFEGVATVRNVFLDRLTSTASAILVGILSGLPIASLAQDQQHKPFVSPSEMPHKTRMRSVVEASPHLNGRWDTTPFHMPINPVHVAMMHTGKVLIISGS